MTPTFTLAFVHLFDLVLLAGLVHYYRKLGYAFLKFGALAMLVVMPIQVFDYIAEFAGVAELATVGIASFAYGCLLLACVNDIVDKAYPFRLVFGLALVLAIAGAFAVFGGAPSSVSWLGVYVPGIIIGGLAVFSLLKGRDPDSIGSLWFAGLIFVGICATIAEPFSSLEVHSVEHFSLLDDLLHLLVAVALIMITSERAIADLHTKDQRIEAYAEEHRRLELQFSHAQKQESLGTLAGGVAHDFNNLLTSILGYASVAMQKLPNDSEVRKDLYMVMSGARQAVDLTSQMLLYAGKGVLQFEAVDISAVVLNMSGLVRSVVPKKIQLVQRLGRDLPTVKGDKVQLGQVVMNLIVNAVDAIEEQAGVIEVTTGIRDVDESLLANSFFSEGRERGAYLFVSVKDSGIGMTDPQLSRIFDPFYSDKQFNKGLGLSSLSGIVRQHKGFIHVESTPGEGSEFIAYFPALSFADGRSERRMVARDGSTRGKVLLADDDPRIRSLMTSILEGDHFYLTSAEDGEEALNLFQQQEGRFDLLVLDCTMPKMSGAEVYEKVRASGSKVPVVLISGYNQEQVTDSIGNDPNAYFLKKPFNLDDFLNGVRTALGQVV